MSTEPEKKDESIVVAEQTDGSATIEGVDAEPEEVVEEKAEGGQVEDDGGEDHPSDTEAIRAVRREKRKLKKQYHRQQQTEKDIRYGQLVKQNQELVERLSVVERKTHGSELARIDKAIEDQQVRVQYAEMKISEATQNSDGEGMKEAQKMWYDARQRVDALENIKQQAATPKERPIAPDRQMQRMAAAWMEKNAWYDPGQGDEDSEIALIIDKKMAKEGWDPKSAEYWEELDNRLQKRLPHHYNEEDEDKPVVRRPRSVVTGSGRESITSSGGKNTFTLNAEQVRAMKDAGMWDDVDKRSKMIRRYAADAKLNRN